MSGHMPSQPAPGGFMPRSISASLLGEGEQDEPPILEELGINFEHIVSKTRSVMWPRRAKLDQAVINDSDFAEVRPLLLRAQVYAYNASRKSGLALNAMKQLLPPLNKG